MFCPRCKCDFIGWKGKCPVCKKPIVEKYFPRFQPRGKIIDYEGLVELVGESGGRLEMELTAAEVGKARRFRFPYIGYGFAWTKRMKGNQDNFPVELWTTEVGIDKVWTFPYFGHGFAREQKMIGFVGGNEITLVANEIAREKKWGFPYRGYGYGWTMEMFGKCGDLLQGRLITTKAGRKKEWQFPYQGYGYAWADRATLTLSLNK